MRTIVAKLSPDEIIHVHPDTIELDQNDTLVINFYANRLPVRQVSLTAEEVRSL